MEDQYVISMDEAERKQLAERLQSYSGMPGIPEAVSEDLVQAAVLIHFNVQEPQENVEKNQETPQETEPEEPISSKFMGVNGFDNIGYANEIIRKFGNIDLNSPDGVDPKF